MYIIIRPGKKDTPYPDDESNAAVRRARADAWDKAQSMKLRDAALERREIIKEMRFKGKRPELIAAARAIRRNMERRINEL